MRQQGRELSQQEEKYQANECVVGFISVIRTKWQLLLKAKGL